MFSSDFLNSLGISNLTAVTMGISLLLLLVVDILRYKSVDVGSLVRKQGTAFRWMVYIGLLLMILVIILKKSITFVYQRKRDSINQLKNKCYENLSNYWTFKFYCYQCSKNGKWCF
jgi:ABC-type multidrug transport system fused ATPase/permease subunit